VSVIAEFSVPAESFAFPHALDALPDARVESDRLATHSREWVLPFVWVRADDQDAVETAMRDDPTVDSHQVVQETDGETLYQVVWTDDVVEFVDEVADQHGVVLSATAADDTWNLALRFVSHDVLASFQAYFRERDNPFELQRVTTPSEPRQREFGLTDEQHEALTLAVDAGYYEVPREVSTADIADDLGVSPNAVSERLRRATASLVENALGGGHT
jgi:predicted DNA binding protein